MKKLLFVLAVAGFACSCQTQPSDKKAEAEMKETVMEEAPAMVEEVAPDSTAMEEDSLAVDAPESEEVVEVAE